MAKKDYYEILNVPRNASSEEIKRAYRKLAIKLHPDRNPNDKAAEESFKQATEAYQTLSDPQKRKMYDQFGHVGAQQSHGAYGGGKNPFEDFAGFGPFGFGRASQDEPHSNVFTDFFGDFFSGEAEKRKGDFHRHRGADLRYTISVTLEEAASGTEKNIHFVRRRRGKDETARLVVKVPAGVKNGQRLKLRGEGDAGEAGGPNGDLYVIVNLQAHDLFTRHENDVQMELPISFVDAILGITKEIPTLTGRASVNIPPGTASGRILRLKGKGFPEVGGYGNGDMLIKIVVDIPKNLGKEELNLVEKLKAVADNSTLIKEFESKFDKVLRSRGQK